MCVKINYIQLLPVSIRIALHNMGLPATCLDLRFCQLSFNKNDRKTSSQQVAGLRILQSSSRGYFLPKVVVLWFLKQPISFPYMSVTPVIKYLPQPQHTLDILYKLFWHSWQMASLTPG